MGLGGHHQVFLSYGTARHGGYVYYERTGMERKCFFESMATTTMHLIHHDGWWV